MKKLRIPLCLLLAMLVLAGVGSALNTAFAAPAQEKTFTVTFALEDGTVIRSYQVPAGETPVYDGPVYARDEYFDYKLTGWTPKLVPATEDVTYYPLYERALRTDDGAKSRLRGDANGDGDVDILDATAIQRYLAGLYDDPHGIINILGVTGRDDELTILDATRIQRYLVGFDNTWLIGYPVTVLPAEPTEPPTQEPTDTPTQEPTDTPSQLPTLLPDPPVSPTDPYELPPV